MKTKTFVEYIGEPTEEINEIPTGDLAEVLYHVDHSLRYCYTYIVRILGPRRMFRYHLEKMTVKEIALPNYKFASFVVDPYIGKHGRLFGVASDTADIVSFDIEYKE